MISLQQFMPPDVSGEAGAVYALLAVIADPKAAKAAMDRMVEHQKSIENATEKQAEQYRLHQEGLQKDRAENEKMRRTADTIASKAAHDLGEAKSIKADADRRLGQCQQIEKQTAEQRAAIEQREEQAQAREKELMHRYREVQRLDGELEVREHKLEQREADLAMREKTLADDIAEHNKWLAGLKPPRAR